MTLEQKAKTLFPIRIDDDLEDKNVYERSIFISGAQEVTNQLKELRAKFPNDMEFGAEVAKHFKL